MKRLYTKRFGYICKGDWCLYCSPDGKVETSTFYIGPNQRERVKSKMRRLFLGHNWLLKLNTSMAPRYISDSIKESVNKLNEQVDAIFDNF